MTAEQGSELLGISLRQVRRVLAAYRRDGAAALSHGNRGRTAAHALDDKIRSRVLELATSKYIGFNTQHFTEVLAEREQIKLSRSTVRRILLNAGVTGPRKRRAPKHRSRRERWAQEGLLLQIDASHHDWLEGRGPKMVLIGAIDDATGKVTDAFFRRREDSEGYFRLLQHIAAKHGLPHAFYHDRHSIFVPPRGEEPSIEEQLEGKKHRTQFGRLLDEMGITPIKSLSPQARGRIERLWGTLQDRLVRELRLASASTIDEANQTLKAYLPNHNARFAVPARQSGSAFRKPPLNWAEHFCFKYSRVVGQDNVVRIGPYRLQVLPSNGKANFAHAKVDVRQSFDNTLALYYQGIRLETLPSQAEPATLRKSPVTSQTVIRPRTYSKPPPDHPWRGKFRQHVDRG